MKNFLFLMCAVCCVLSCSEDDAPVEKAPSLPVMQTILVDEVRVNEVKVSANIVSLGDGAIVDHGFIYSTEVIQKADQGQKLALGAQAATGMFSGKIADLKKATTYYVRPYVATQAEIVMGGSTTIKTQDTDTWFQIPLAAVDNNTAAVAHNWGQPLEQNGKGYVGFGLAVVGSNEVTPLSEYDPATHTLTRLADCPIKQTYYAGRFALRNKIYVMNGSTQEFAQYDIASKTWKKLNNFPKQVGFSHSFVLFDQGYFITSAPWTQIWRYNEVEDSWAVVSEWPENIKPYVHSAMVLDGKVYLVTAHIMQPRLSYVYDPLKDTYTKLSTPPLPATVNGDSGNTSYGVANASAGVGYYVQKEPNGNGMWEYNPAKDTWRKLTAPNYNNGASIFVSGKNLYSINQNFFMYVPAQP